MSIDQAALLRMYEIMTTIRRCDDKAQELIMTGRLVLFYHSPRGQEAIGAAIGAVLRPEDRTVSTYRDLHEAIGKGIPLRDIWSEWLGKSTGSCRGRGGPMHISDPEIGLMATSGIVGGGLPISVGVALAAQLRGTGQVTTCSFGDGASNIGAFHESLNMASIWSLPIVFICQNNGYAEHMSFAKGTSVDRIADRGTAYRMPAVTVDGNDPIATCTALSEAVDRARLGGGPTLVEAMTYRLSGHYVGDDNHYLPENELAEAARMDPVPAFRARLIEEYGASEVELKTLDQRAAEGVDEAYEFALASPDPNPADLLVDVFSATEGSRR